MAKNTSNTIVDFLLKHNKEQMKGFSDPDAALFRRQYRARYPTEIAALKCMDGRLNLPVMANIPVGIIKPFRNIGGIFDLGWPFFGVLLQDWVKTAVERRGHDAIIITTYHFSKSDAHLGCAGWNYNKEASVNASFKLRDQCERVFGEEHTVVYPIVVGIETDEDALIFHGKDGAVLNLAEETSTDEKVLAAKLHSLLPDMKEQMVHDLLPLLVGNIAHIAEVRKENRTQVEAGHREQIMGIGRGFDWLHLHNKALLIGPFSFDLREPIAKAAGILLKNLQTSCIPKDDGVVILTSAVFNDETGTEKRMAMEKTYALARLAEETIVAAVPDLVPHLHFLVGILDLNSREFIPLPYESKSIAK